jgi:hypothetical protein
MVGKIFITRSGYDPQLGSHIKDPYLGTNPTLGACRPDIRKQLKAGDHIFVISGKVPQASQFVIGGFEVKAKIPAIEAYGQFPELRLHQLEDGQLTGNIIVSPNGEQHHLDQHSPETFQRRIKDYVIGTNPIALTTDDEIAKGRQQTMGALREIFRRHGTSPIEIVGRWGKALTEEQIALMRDWLLSLKSSKN